MRKNNLKNQKGGALATQDSLTTSVAAPAVSTGEVINDVDGMMVAKHPKLVHFETTTANQDNNLANS